MVERESMTEGQLLLVDQLTEYEEDKVLYADGFEEAFIGTVSRCNQPTIAAYDTDKCISILMRQGMSHEEAWEYFQFNVIGAYVGEYTPCFVAFALGFSPYEFTDKELEKE